MSTTHYQTLAGFAKQSAAAFPRVPLLTREKERERAREGGRKGGNCRVQKVRRKIASGFNLSARRPVGRFISGRKTDTRARAVAVTRLSFLSLSSSRAAKAATHALCLTFTILRRCFRFLSAAGNATARAAFHDERAIHRTPPPGETPLPPPTPPLLSISRRVYRFNGVVVGSVSLA